MQIRKKYFLTIFTLCLTSQISCSCILEEIMQEQRSEKPVTKVIEINEEVKPNKSNSLPRWWRVKRWGYKKLLQKNVSSAIVSGHVFPLPPENETVEIVPLSSMGIPIANVFSAHTPPKNERSKIRGLISKVLSFLLNNFPLVTKGLPEIPEDNQELLSLCFPPEYQALLPKPEFPDELSDNPDDTVGGCALSGPFARHIRKANAADIIGAPDLLKSDDLYIIELPGYEYLPVKSGLETLGGKAILSYNKDTGYMQTNCIKHKDSWYTKNDVDWSHAQKIIMATVSNDSAIVRHLLNTHLIISGTFSSVTNQTLKADHPIRILLHPHQYGALSTNLYNLPILFSGSWIESIFSYDQSTLSNFLGSKAAKFSMTSLNVHKDLKKRRMKNTEFDYPYAQNTTKLWDIIQTYVRNYVNNYYTKDTLTADEQLQSWYCALKKYIPNNQVQVYAPTLSKRNLVKLLTLYIYTDSVEHYNVGASTFNFQFWQNQVPSQVRIDRKRPSIGIA